MTGRLSLWSSGELGAGIYLALVLAASVGWTGQAVAGDSLLGTSGVCPLLESPEVSYLFPAAKDSMQVRYRDKPHRSCTFTWKASSEATRVIGGQTISIPGSGRLTITQATLVSPESDWQRVLASYGGETLQQVPATGSRARWSENRGQLSVLAKKHIYNVAIEDPDGPGSIRDRAIKIALLLVDQFD